MNDIVIRIRCEVGFFRFEMNKNKKILDLKTKIEELLNIPINKQILYYEGNKCHIINNDNMRLIDYNIIDGTLIEVHSIVKPEVKKNKIENKNNYENINEKNDIQNKNQTNILNEQNNTNNPMTPIFKSFDSFLKSRGYNTSDLPINISYKSINITKGKMIKIPLSVTLKHQPYRHVDHLELMNISEIQNFVNYWYEVNNMIEQRGGWMYGYYKEDHHYELGIRAVCECIYEPPQHNENGQLVFEQDDFLETVDLIAAKLGLERIGWIFTHLPRDEYLTSKEVINIAKMQLSCIKKNHYTGYNLSNFVTCTISLNDIQKEPLTNAFMVSDLGMALVRDNLILDNQNDSTHIELRKQEKNELLPLILEGGKETTKFDAHWFIIRVNESAPKVVRSIFKNTHFSRENRKTLQTNLCAREYFNSELLNTGVNSIHKYSDFHLILFVSKVLGLETAFAICESILNKKEVDPVIEEMLTSIVV